MVSSSRKAFRPTALALPLLNQNDQSITIDFMNNAAGQCRRSRRTNAAEQTNV
jgi:hypothetical protein